MENVKQDTFVDDDNDDLFAGSGEEMIINADGDVVPAQPKIILSDHDFAQFEELINSKPEPTAFAVAEMRRYMDDIASGDLIVVESDDTDLFGLPHGPFGANL